ncbi:hypothetical protein KDJ21_018445 [Metabacillus litoralis]|jgi:hypothetical protein|uniref:hypothetical protein n=1 Tax=Metabacillus TaxID=2675233 RepID=UPI001B9638AF|nr:hypothetical protein [Metabacillus litoralis]UHA58792.1 hypothetical protein KDJ21_018445 [Metabacillus litoralis]
MKYVVGLYIVMAVMVFVNGASVFIFKDEFSAIASWLTVMLFLLGTIFFVNARYYLSKK